MAPSGKALLLPGSLAASKPILISQIITDGLLYPYTRSVGTYHWPGDHSKAEDDPTQLRLRSYGQNIMLNGHWIPDGPPFDGYVVQTKTTGYVVAEINSVRLPGVFSPMWLPRSH